ncbi:sigma-70 family RNA polymerase sigma factor [uncultured Sphaerochaeta sp.]|uniref:sigma-70 family RNA polymerase sigma factor n=1 Tax=uncultured Sphaerochaeta sp. TaxID=886478 RepID=UPI002612B090|nr:sigma-70 family RNA polymerase sigma factor [uncultured Sphaerochaeta sp.]
MLTNGDIEALYRGSFAGLEGKGFDYWVGVFRKYKFSMSTAEELAQEVFLRILRSAGDIRKDAPGELVMLMRTIARNVAADFRKSIAGKSTLESEPDDESESMVVSFPEGKHEVVAVPADAEDQLIEQETLKENLAKLTSQEALVADAYALSPGPTITQREVAVKLGITEDMVQKRLKSAREKLSVVNQ